MYLDKHLKQRKRYNQEMPALKIFLALVLNIYSEEQLF